jgi:hypothetical protein
MANRFRSEMTSLVLGDLILESFTPSVNAPHLCLATLEEQEFPKITIP